MAEEENIKHAGGRPPLFETPEALQEKIDQYFEVFELSQRTITGIAIFLGFESRQSFYDYEKNPQFSYIIKKARLQVEHAYETKLSTNNVTGAIFALKNMGWTDNKSIELSGNAEKPLGAIDYDKLPTETLQAILNARISQD